MTKKRTKLKKLKLISPTIKIYSSGKNEIRWRMPPYTLALIAALTPGEVDIEIADENVEEIRYDDNPDLVGISCTTLSAKSTYEIAQKYREQGIPVIIGGIHPTVLPEEVAPHADAIVIGEAELIWEQVIKDFEAGSLKKVYKGKKLHDLKGLPMPRRDLFEKNRDKYNYFNTIQTTRGCPYDCEFCSTGIISGRKIRKRPIDEVVAEIKEMKFGKMRLVAFYDDAINSDPKYAKELFKALIPLNIVWIAQASAKIGEDDELLRLAREAGCRCMAIGLETIKSENYDSMIKAKYLKYNYSEIVQRIHKHNITVHGYFIFGMDGDSSSVFRETYEFMKESKLDSFALNMVVPFPGTRLYKRLKEEGRLLSENFWYDFSLINPYYIPSNMTPEELQEGFKWFFKKVGNRRAVLKRIARGTFDRRDNFLFLLG
ncbi:MAG: B12-binding domain-containing radical SAM protein, partial [bacterium]|nr:B12-binding domain-containing radical SAM protein [bacterium]